VTQAPPPALDATRSSSVRIHRRISPAMAIALTLLAVLFAAPLPRGVDGRTLVRRERQRGDDAEGALEVSERLERHEMLLRDLLGGDPLEQALAVEAVDIESRGRSSSSGKRMTVKSGHSRGTGKSGRSTGKTGRTEAEAPLEETATEAPVEETEPPVEETTTESPAEETTEAPTEPPVEETTTESPVEEAPETRVAPVEEGTTEAPEEATSTAGRFCCSGLSVSCLSCVAGISVEAYCTKKPETPGCKAADVVPFEKPEETTGCCSAPTADCLACLQGLTVRQFCARRPFVPGCPWSSPGWR